MFGYVNIYKDELKIKDYNLWRSYYCGLCKSLGKNYNQLTRLGLNYDMTFLAVMIGGVLEEKPKIKKERCIAHPINKRFTAYSDKAISYASAISIVLTKEKLSDDINDDKKLLAYFLKIPYLYPYKKAEIYCKTREIQKYLRELYTLEKEDCKDIDKIADKFALIMAEIMTPAFIPEDKKTLMYDFGYNLGKWIYIIDAVNDFYEDKKKNKYNPFKNLDIEEIEFNLTYTLSQLGKIFGELKLNMNKDLIENIIFMGLRSKQDSIINKLKGKDNNESL